MQIGSNLGISFGSRLSVIMVLLVLPIMVPLPSYIPLLFPNAYATSSYELQPNDTNHDCEAITGSWSSPTCTLSYGFSLGRGDSLIIDSGVKLTSRPDESVTIKISSGGNLTNFGTINTTISVLAIFLNSGGTITNSGTIFGNVDIANGYLYDVRIGTSPTKSGGTITNSGTINTSSMENYNGSIIINGPGSTIDIYNTFSNSGALTNEGSVINSKIAVITNNGDISNYGNITISGGAVANYGGTINNTNSGNIYVYDTRINPGSLYNAGETYEPMGEITYRPGIIYNSGTIDVYANDTSSSSFINHGIIYNCNGAINKVGSTNNSLISGNPAVNGCIQTPSLSMTNSTVGISITIPSWIKNTAKWWSQGKMGDPDFTSGIQYLLKQKIIHIPPQTQIGTGSQQIPAWVKNTAGWWASGKMSDDDFIKGIEYLVRLGIIKV